jgi:RNA polymerase sigma-70 factor (ECF subfamily)
MMPYADAHPPAQATDAALLAASLGGDGQAFTTLYRRHGATVYRFAYLWSGAPNVASDVAQETFIHLHTRGGDFDPGRGELRPWLLGIARNLVLAHYRSAARQVLFSNDRMLEYLDQRMAQVDARAGDTLDEKIAALTDCLQRLAPMYREPVDLHYRQRRTSEWIADHLKTTKDAIQKRLQRARLQLAECLGRKGVLSELERAT